MARKPAKKSRKRTTPNKTEPTPSPEGRLWFDEHGHLNQSGPVPLSRYLGGLSDQLRLFLARLDSCERTDAGGYLLRDARAGNLGGMRVLWDNVVLLAQASIAKTLPGMTPDQHAAMKRDGVFVTTTGPTRNAQPLADALRQLLFSILYNADGSWVSEIPSATVAKIRTIGDELTQHRTAWERSEGGTTRTPTVSVSPDLLQRLEAGIAAVSSMRSNFDAGMERVGRMVESVRPRDDDDGHAKPPALPAAADESAGPALTANQSRVLQTMALFDASRLVSADAIAGEMDAAGRLSARTIGPIVRRLIELRLAERPEGDRSGTRLTTAGRRLAPKIAD